MFSLLGDSYLGCPSCSTYFCPGSPVCDSSVDVDDPKEVKRHIEAKNDFAAIEKAIKTIIDQLNRGNKAVVSNAIASGLLRSHRTLQQSFASVALRAILEYFALCDREGGRMTDARNEAAAKLGTKLLETYDEVTVGRGLPFV